MASSSRARRPGPAQAPRSFSTLLPAALIVAAAFATYWNGLGGAFVWDDETAIVTNQTIQRLWPPSVPLQPPRETPVAGRPIVNLTLAVNYAIGGLSETGYHVANVALHAACALLLFALIRLTLGTRALRNRVGRSSTTIALVATLLWTVHPLQSEVVNYVTQRTESVMAMFYLLTLYCSARSSRAGGANAPIGRDRNAVRWQIAAVLACALGMASKESMVTAPLMVVLYDRAFLFESWRETFESRKQLYAGLAGTWLILAVIILQQPRSTAGLATPIGSWTYLLNQIQMIGRYLWLIVWPRTLVLDYGLPRPLGLADVLPSALVVLPLAAAALVAFVRWPRVGFSAVAFFLILAPTSSIVPISSEVGAERRMYLSLAAAAVLVTVGVRAGLDTRGSSRSARLPAIAGGLAVIAIVLLAGRTMARNADYASGRSLWKSVIDARPNGRARMALATELITAGLHDDALFQLREAVRDYPDARYGLGTELVLTGQVEEGVAELRTFIAAKPDNLNRIPGRLLIAQALASRGRMAEAAEELRALLRIVPQHDTARATLADVLFAMRRYDEATAEYRALDGTQPNNAAVQSKLGASLLATGRTQEAINYFQKAHERDPGSVTLNRSLAEAYLRQQQAAAAEPYAREAVRLAPADGPSHNLLAIALVSTGRFAEGVEQFRESLRLNPGDQQAQANLDRAMRMLPQRPK